MSAPTTRQLPRSSALLARARQAIPGGVNSPVRAFNGVGGEPVFFRRGVGAWLHDVDDNRYIDYVCSWGALILGHAHEKVTAAVQNAAADGLGFGAPTEIECRFAETLCAAMPSMEMVRAVNSGSEATMSAIRVARGATNRDLLVKFAGCYHGHADSLLVAAGSGALTLGKPSSAGVPIGATKDTLVLPYNDAAAAAELFDTRGDDIAAVIVEPVAGNMNLVPGDADFLRVLRQKTEKHGAVLIFDEVMSGFRVARGGAQQLYNIAPDLTCLGKVVGGGLSVAAFGGGKKWMAHLAPLGDVYQAGTLSGNPVALSAGLATLEIVLGLDGADNDFFVALDKTGAALITALTDAAKKHGIAFSASHLGGMFGLYFRELPPRNFAEVQECDIKMFRAFFMRCCGAAYILRHLHLRRVLSASPTAKTKLPAPPKSPKNLLPRLATRVKRRQFFRII